MNCFHDKISKTILLFILLLSCCFTDAAYAQKETDAAAKVGASEITVKEFQDRYEFMPHLNYSSNNPDTVKKEFLYSLIAEKLWALKGLENRFDTLESVRYSLEALRRLLIKDELYRNEVESRIEISNEDISSGLQKAGHELLINIISSKDSAEIFNISDKLIKGSDYDSLLSTRKEKTLQQSPVRINFGSLPDEKVENIIYGISSGEISLPVKSGEGWFIFKVISKNQNTDVNISNERTRNSVIKTLREREIQKQGGAYLDSLIGGKRIEADKNVFLKIYNTMYSVISEEYQSDSTDSSFNAAISEKNILHTINKLGSGLNDSFIKFDDGEASAKDFLYYLYYQKIELKSLSSEHFRNILSSAVRRFIEDEMLVIEGIRKDLADNRNVTETVNIWREHYSAQLMMESFYDSAKINEDELQNYTELQDLNTATAEEKRAFKTQVELNRLQKILTGKTIEYAREYPISINEQTLESLKLSELNTFTYKLIGFGGRIAALPVTIPMYEWYYIIKETDKSILP